MFKRIRIPGCHLILASLFMAGFSAAHAAIVIDTFDGPDQQAPPDNEIDAPSAIGGKRLLSGGLESTGIVSNGLWLSIEGNSPGGAVSVTYRGDGTLGGIDLTEGSLNIAFEIVIAARTAFQGETLALTVADSGSGNSSFSVNWVDLPFSGSYLIPFSSLAGDADLTSVDIITVSNTIPTLSGDGVTMAIDTIRVVPSEPTSTTIASSNLPTSRSVQVGSLASVFATIINGGSVTATGCSIAPQTSVAADFAYQTTDASNVPTGTPNTPADIPAGGSQNYIFGFMPTAPISPTEVVMIYDCTNSDPAPSTVGLNTLLLSAEAAPVPDIVALAATPTGDGILSLPGTNGSNAFSVATVNVGSTDTITASADAGSLPVFLSVCETNPDTGACLSAPASETTSSVNADATPTYSVFVTGNGNVPSDPANNRINVVFRDAGGAVRGATSVAVRTQ